MKKISAIILCAGISERMGTDKSLLDFGNLKSIELIIEKIKKIKFSQIIIVAGKNKKNIEKYIQNENLAINTNHDYRSLSIKKGLELVDGENGCLIWPVDYPLVKKETLRSLKKSYKEDSIVCPVHKKRGGHPILIGAKILGSLKKIHPETPLRDWTKKQKRKILKTSDIWVNYEMNTKEEYIAAKEILKNQFKFS